jgi:hypothetical protein
MGFFLPPGISGGSQSPARTETLSWAVLVLASASDEEMEEGENETGTSAVVTEGRSGIREGC